jgi:hypothetical protein
MTQTATPIFRKANGWIEHTGIAALVVIITASSTAADRSAIDFESFLNRHDMLWDRIPNRWEVAPYTGNSNVGFLFNRARGEARNVISIYAGRHDYYDHRLPHEGHEMLWIYRRRLPGHKHYYKE